MGFALADRKTYPEFFFSLAVAENSISNGSICSCMGDAVFQPACDLKSFSKAWGVFY